MSAMETYDVEYHIHEDGTMTPYLVESLPPSSDDSEMSIVLYQAPDPADMEIDDWCRLVNYKSAWAPARPAAEKKRTNNREGQLERNVKRQRLDNKGAKHVKNARLAWVERAYRQNLGETISPGQSPRSAGFDGLNWKYCVW
ncbi:hypothetical protein B0T20DRAFT_476488 [Sordaria brevicollis]|uniref:Uncharacterized protein n=1 Tax=Sordaria brevicollis TaxID=83679 RepID=A0AAE0UFQ8_SORBR|nr:hypothetical protein B0T20DRAFT_476488 [Sordaria brevicollis]